MVRKNLAFNEFPKEIKVITTIVACALAALIGLGSWMFFKDDNVVEETAEEFILKESGIEIDLSPSSKEEK